MQNHLTRIMIAKLSGCEQSEVAKVLQAARFLQTRKDNTGVLNLHSDGLCSGLPPTAKQEQQAEEIYHSLVASLADGLGGREDALNYLSALKNPNSYLYGSDDDEAEQAEKDSSQPPRRRRRRPC